MSRLAAIFTIVLGYLVGYLSAATSEAHSAAPTLLTSGYYYVQVYSASTCASSDSDIQYVSGYKLNTCLPQYDTSGSAIGSMNFTCSLDIGGDVNIYNYTSTDCTGTSEEHSYPIDTCTETNNTDFTDGIIYGLSYAHRCVNQLATSVSTLPITFDAVTTVGYGNSLCVYAADDGIQTFSASAINLCFNAPNKNFYGEFSCNANKPEVTQYNSSEATCATGGEVTALPITCTSISTISSNYPAKSNFLSAYYQSSCNLEPTMTPTAVPTTFVSSNAPTPISIFPTPAPTNFADIQGYVYKQYYSDAQCQDNNTVHYTGYATGVCLATYISDTDVPEGSQTYGVCSSASTTTFATKFLADYNCTADGTETVTTITLNTCMSETFYSGMQYYKWMCTDSTDLPVTYDSVVINTYTGACNDYPVAFSAFVEDKCIDHYGDSGNSSASYSCEFDTDEGYVPVKTYYNSSQECSGFSHDIMLPEECTAQYTYYPNPLEEESSSSSSSYYMYSYYNYDVDDVGLYSQAYCYAYSTLRPSLKPTNMPTFKAGSPTPAPTDARIIDISVQQTIDNFGVSSYYSNTAVYEYTIAEAISEALEASELTGAITISSIVESTRRRLLDSRELTTASVVVSYTIVANALAFSSPDKAFTSYVTAIDKSISSGSFNNALQASAVANNAVGLAGASSSSPVTATYVAPQTWNDDTTNNDDDDDDNNGLSNGGIAGIVVMVLVIVCGTSFFAYRYYKRSTTEKSLRELLTDNSSPNRKYPQPGSGHHEDVIINETKAKNPMQL